MVAPFCHSLSTDATTLSSMRRQFRGWLATLDWPRQEITDLSLILNEAVAGTMEHAYRHGARPGQDGLRITAQYTTYPDGCRGAIIEVLHHVPGRADPDPDNAGPDLEFMRAGTELCDIVDDTASTRIWLVSRPVRPRAATPPADPASIATNQGPRPPLT
jgi:hypothetical protein